MIFTGHRKKRVKNNVKTKTFKNRINNIKIDSICNKIIIIIYNIKRIPNITSLNRRIYTIQKSIILWTRVSFYLNHIKLTPHFIRQMNAKKKKFITIKNKLNYKIEIIILKIILNKILLRK